MGKTTGIEWTESTWNPLRGCTRVSEGCRNCYAERVSARFSSKGQPFHLIAERSPSGPRWTGKVILVESMLREPIKWKEPRRIFVNSMSDLFHEAVTDEWLAKIFDVMERAPQHVYQILTKRPLRMLTALRAVGATPPNWWFGVSIEDQQSARARLPVLAETPCALRWVSYEPALGPVDLAAALAQPNMTATGAMLRVPAAIQWIVVGGESGPGSRHFDPAWARTVLKVCREQGIPFFMKQMGGRSTHNDVPIPDDLLIKEMPTYDVPRFSLE